MGLLSMAVAAVFMVRQRDFKRMLAYSSVEHMGILVLGVGIGGLAVYGALLHLINNGLTKGVLFLSAGNIHRAYGSKITDEVAGRIRRVPLSGALFLAGFLAITGSPPFGPFVSEFTIVNARDRQRAVLWPRPVPAPARRRVRRHGGDRAGRGPGDAAATRARPTRFRDSFGTAGPILLFLALVLLLGLYIPPPLESLLREAAAFLEVKPMSDTSFAGAAQRPARSARAASRELPFDEFREAIVDARGRRAAGRRPLRRRAGADRRRRRSTPSSPTTPAARCAWPDDASERTVSPR